MYRGKFVFKDQLGQSYSWKELYRFSLFYFVSEGNFQVQAPWGAYIWRGDLTEDFLRWECGGLIFGGAYTQRGLFSEFRLPATQATTHGRELLHSMMKLLIEGTGSTFPRLDKFFKITMIDHDCRLGSVCDSF